MCSGPDLSVFGGIAIEYGEVEPSSYIDFAHSHIYPVSADVVFYLIVFVIVDIWFQIKDLEVAAELRVSVGTVV